METGRAAANRGRDNGDGLTNSVETRRTCGQDNPLINHTGGSQTHLEAHKDVRTIESNGKN